MLATNHEAIYDRWSALLQTGLQKIDSPADPYCVYLGNWIADMSQIYDPAVGELLLQVIGAPETLTEKLRQLGGNVLFKLKLLTKAARLLGVDADLLGKLDDVAKKGRQHLKGLAALKSVPKIDIAGPQVFASAMETIYLVVKLMCLKRFGQGEEPKKISATVVYAMFDEHFGTYMPHQHLDRPLSCDLVGAATPAEIKTDFPRYVTAAPGQIDIGMKGYLHDAITVACGFLNSLSLRNPLVLDQADLVKLGFTLHVVEDYFAHSNFLERLIVCNSDLKDKWVNDFAPTEMAKLATSNTEMVGLSAPKGGLPAFDFVHLPPEFSGTFEPQVVTGFFGPTDVYHSLLHAIGDKIAAFWELEPRLPQPKSDNLAEAGEKPASVEFLDVFELMFVTAPKDALAERQQARAHNQPVPALRKALLSRLNAPGARRLVDEAGIPLQYYPDLSESCAAQIARLSGAGDGDMSADDDIRMRMVADGLGSAVELMRLVKAAAETVSLVLQAVRDEAMRYPAIAGAVEAAFAKGAAFSERTLTRLEKELLTEPVIGSHSSIAKDEGHGQSILYRKAESFAVAMDSFVLSTLFGVHTAPAEVTDPGGTSDPPGATEAAEDAPEAPDEGPPAELPLPVRWDSTLMGLLTDPVQVYGKPVAGVVGARYVDVVPVTPQSLTQEILTGFGRSGFRAFDEYFCILGKLNPEIECTGHEFRFAPEASETVILIPFAEPQPSRGYLMGGPAFAADDWRRTLYFEGTADLRHKVVRGAPDDLRQAISQASRTRERLVADYQAVLVHLFPALQDFKLKQGYYGIAAGP